MILQFSTRGGGSRAQFTKRKMWEEALWVQPADDTPSYKLLTKMFAESPYGPPQYSPTVSWKQLDK